MAYLKDFQITPTIRDSLNHAYKNLDLSREAVEALAERLGVQGRTLEGWVEGRGSPIPRAALGHFAYDGSLQEDWQDRVILGAALLGRVGQGGAEGKAGAYRDDVSGGTLLDALDRIKDYLAGETADDYLRRSWRRILLYEDIDGWSLEVQYARIHSSEE